MLYDLNFASKGLVQLIIEYYMYYVLLSRFRVVDKETSFSTVCIHVINSVYVLTELLLNAIPVRLLHLWLPELFGFTYTAFSVLRWRMTSSEPIYDMLDYSTSPLLCLLYVIVVAFVICPMFHFATFTVYHCKVLLHRKVMNSKDVLKVR